MRKIIVYIAVSADGYIARPDGDVAWLDRPRVRGNYGMDAFYKTIDTVLMGRRTYDVAVRLGMPSYPGMKNVVFTTRRPRRARPDVEFVSGDIAEFARGLRRSKGGGKNIWLVGGAELVASFLDAGEIDEFMIFVVPVFIGKGISLIAPRHREIPLKLLRTKAYRDGVVQLHYAVGGPARKRAD